MLSNKYISNDEQLYIKSGIALLRSYKLNKNNKYKNLRNILINEISIIDIGIDDQELKQQFDQFKIESLSEIDQISKLNF